MIKLFLDIITTTLLIAIPFTALYAAFWIWLGEYLEKRNSSYGYNHDNKNTIKFIGISYQSNNGVDFGFTYPPAKQIYGPKCPITTYPDYERQNNSQLPEQKTYHKRRRRRSKSLFPW